MGRRLRGLRREGKFFSIGEGKPPTLDELRMSKRRKKKMMMRSVVSVLIYIYNYISQSLAAAKCEHGINGCLSARPLAYLSPKSKLRSEEEEEEEEGAWGEGPLPKRSER